jgi:uncharacterized protein
VPVSRNLAAVRASYQHFADGDLDRFVESLAPGFVSEQSAAVPWRGVHRGHDGVRRMFGKVSERAEATFEPAEFIEGEDRVVVLGTARLTPRSTGETTVVRELHVWHVEDGRLRALTVFLNAPARLLADLGP